MSATFVVRHGLISTSHRSETDQYSYSVASAGGVTTITLIERGRAALTLECTDAEADALGAAIAAGTGTGP